MRIMGVMINRQNHLKSVPRRSSNTSSGFEIVIMFFSFVRSNLPVHFTFFVTHSLSVAKMCSQKYGIPGF